MVRPSVQVDSCLWRGHSHNLAGSYRPPVALEGEVQEEEPGPKVAVQLAGVRIPALRKSYQEAAVPKVAGDQPVEAEVRTRGNLEAHRGGTHEVPAHWDQYMACMSALAAERQLGEAARQLGEGERFRGCWIPELWDRGEPHSRRRRKHLGVSAVCFGLQSRFRLKGPWVGLQELKSKLSF